jgi:hypothetical protein
VFKFYVAPIILRRYWTLHHSKQTCDLGGAGVYPAAGRIGPAGRQLAIADVTDRLWRFAGLATTASGRSYGIICSSNRRRHLTIGSFWNRSPRGGGGGGWLHSHHHAFSCLGRVSPLQDFSGANLHCTFINGIEYGSFSCWHLFHKSTSHFVEKLIIQPRIALRVAAYHPTPPHPTQRQTLHSLSNTLEGPLKVSLTESHFKPIRHIFHVL